MERKIKNYILDLANECVLYSENAIDVIEHNFNSTIQFLNQAFFCSKKLEDFYYSHCNVSELQAFYKHFFHLNEIVLKNNENKSAIFKELETFKKIYGELKTNILGKSNAIDVTKIISI